MVQTSIQTENAILSRLTLVRPPHRADATARADRSRRVLVLSGDTQVGLWVLRSCARNGLTVFAICNSPAGQAAHSRYCSGAWMLDRSANAAPVAEQIAALARHLEVGSVMPISEGHHSTLAAARASFEPEIHIFTPPSDVFARATDKGAMHRLCEELGVPVARGTTLDQLIEGGIALQFPLVLRTRRQNLSYASAPWKAAYANDQQELAKLHSSATSYADNILVQEYHAGVEVHVQVLMHGGEAFMVGEYIGEHHMPLAGGVTVQRVSCRHEPVIRDAVRILKAVGWEGIAAVQFHYDPATDKYIFLEINPRFAGGLPTVIMAGFEAPFLLWQSHFEPQAMRQSPYRIGLRTRILGGDANWMLGMLRGDQLPPGQRRLGKVATLCRFFWNFGPWTKDDSFMLGDMKPFFSDFRQMIRRLKSDAFDILGQTQDKSGPT
jgi:predicted ATP-grasp superfamily ATP-dependent carboligase